MAKNANPNFDDATNSGRLNPDQTPSGSGRKGVAGDKSASYDFGRYWAAILLIAAGVIVLLNNIGVLPWSLWFFIVQFWPVLLIFFGLDLILRRNLWARIGILVLGTVVLVVGIALGVINYQPSLYNDLRQQLPWLPPIATSGLQGQEGLQDFHYRVEAQEFSDVTSRQVDASFEFGKVTLTDEPQDFYADVEANFSSDAYSPGVEAEQDDGELKIDITPQSERGFTFFWGEQSLDYSVAIGSNTTPTSVVMDIGAGRGILDFSQTIVRQLELKVGAGRLDAQLSEESLPSEGAEIDVGMGSVTLTIPDGVAVRAEYDIGLGTFEVDGEEVEGDEVYQSANYSSAEHSIDLRINVGLGKIKIVHK